MEQAKRQSLMKKKKKKTTLQVRDKEMPEINDNETFLSSIDLNGDETAIKASLLRERSQEVTSSTKIENVNKNRWKVVDILKMRENYSGAQEYLVRWQKGANIFDSYHAWELEINLKCKILIQKYHSHKL